MSSPIGDWVRERISDAHETARAFLVQNPDHPGVLVDLEVAMPDGEVVTMAQLTITRGDVGL